MSLPHSPSEPTVSDENRDGYDRWSALYDGYVNSTVAADDLYFPKLWADIHECNVLEIGCGTGRHTVRLATAGNTVTGVDISGGMLAQARAKLAGLPHVRLIEADFMAQSLGFVDFDTVVTALVLEHIAEPAVFFLRVAEALKAGGRLFLSEIHPDRIAAGTQANFVDAQGVAVKLRSFAHSAAEIEGAAAQAGLRLNAVQDVIGGEDLVAVNADWTRHLCRKMLRMWTFEKAVGG